MCGWAGWSARLQVRPNLTDIVGMWNYVLRHRLLLRAIYRRSEAA